MQMDGFGVEIKLRGNFPRVSSLCEPEHDPLAGPVQRDIVLPHDLAAGKFGRLGPVDDRCYDIGRQITEANKLVQMARGIMRDHRLRDIVDQMISCCKGMRYEAEQDGISLARCETLIWSDGEFPVDTPRYQLGIDAELMPFFMVIEEQIYCDGVSRYLSARRVCAVARSRAG